MSLREAFNRIAVSQRGVMQLISNCGELFFNLTLPVSPVGNLLLQQLHPFTGGIDSTNRLRRLRRFTPSDLAFEFRDACLQFTNTCFDFANSRSNANKFFRWSRLRCSQTTNLLTQPRAFFFEFDKAIGDGIDAGDGLLNFGNFIRRQGCRTSISQRFTHDQFKVFGLSIANRKQMIENVFVNFTKQLPEGHTVVDCPVGSRDGCFVVTVVGFPEPVHNVFTILL